jgi:hypothetical protein
LIDCAERSKEGFRTTPLLHKETRLAPNGRTLCLNHFRHTGICAEDSPRLGSRSLCISPRRSRSIWLELHV